MRSWILAALVALSSAAAAQDAADLPADELIHADLPLFGGDTAQMWPQHIGGDEIGCASRVAFGIWKFQGADDDDVQWHRIANYGVFHCSALLATSDTSEDLTNAQSRPAFFILAGKTTDRELWALQVGARPGSDYILLARKPGDGIVKRFDVLQRDCPKSMVRDAQSIDTLTTRYCAIDSRGGLAALAREMAKRPPLGSLTWVKAEPD